MSSLRKPDEPVSAQEGAFAAAQRALTYVPDVKHPSRAVRPKGYPLPSDRPDEASIHVGEKIRAVWRALASESADRINEMVAAVRDRLAETDELLAVVESKATALRSIQEWLTSSAHEAGLAAPTFQEGELAARLTYAEAARVSVVAVLEMMCDADDTVEWTVARWANEALRVIDTRYFAIDSGLPEQRIEDALLFAAEACADGLRDSPPLFFRSRMLQVDFVDRSDGRLASSYRVRFVYPIAALVPHSRSHASLVLTAPATVRRDGPYLTVTPEGGSTHAAMIRSAESRISLDLGVASGDLEVVSDSVGEAMIAATWWRSGSVEIIALPRRSGATTKRYELLAFVGADRGPGQLRDWSQSLADLGMAPHDSYDLQLGEHTVLATVVDAGHPTTAGLEEFGEVSGLSLLDRHPIQSRADSTGVLARVDVVAPDRAGLVVDILRACEAHEARVFRCDASPTDAPSQGTFWASLLLAFDDVAPLRSIENAIRDVLLAAGDELSRVWVDARIVTPREDLPPATPSGRGAVALSLSGGPGRLGQCLQAVAEKGISIGGISSLYEDGVLLAIISGESDASLDSIRGVLADFAQPQGALAILTSTGEPELHADEDVVVRVGYQIEAASVFGAMDYLLALFEERDWSVERFRSAESLECHPPRYRTTMHVRVPPEAELFGPEADWLRDVCLQGMDGREGALVRSLAWDWQPTLVGRYVNWLEATHADSRHHGHSAF